jgi:hypothetical protein
MRRRSLIESYALLVCLGMLVCFLVALYFLGYGTIAREAPEYTIYDYTYRSHQTNERYWDYASIGEQRPRPSEEALTAERERSWRAALQLEQRDGTRTVWLCGLGLVVSSVVFCIHWRIARRVRHAERGAESDTIRHPLALASAIVFGLGFCSCCGLAVGWLGGTLQIYRMMFVEERAAVEPILESDVAFRDVTLHERSNGGIYLIGVVPTEPDLDRLRARVERALGERRGKEVMSAVGVTRVARP